MHLYCTLNQMTLGPPPKLDHRHNTALLPQNCRKIGRDFIYPSKWAKAKLEKAAIKVASLEEKHLQMKNLELGLQDELFP